MDLVVENLGKIYQQNWIFKDINANISSGQKWGVRGRNGAGKSTLLSILLKLTLPTKGKVSWYNNGAPVDGNDLGKCLSFAAPYAVLFDEFSGQELIGHLSKLRPLRSGMDAKKVMELALLADQGKKKLFQYSTGMQMRFKLALALATDSAAVILDEPTSNLDLEGKAWFSTLIEEHLEGRTLIIASNEASDFKACEKFIDLQVS